MSLSISVNYINVKWRVKKSRDLDYLRKKVNKWVFSILIQENFVPLHSHPPHAVAVELVRVYEAVKKRGRKHYIKECVADALFLTL